MYFKGLKISCRIFFPFLGTMVTCIISSTSFYIKGDVFEAKEVQERQEKSYTCKSGGEIIKQLERTLDI